MRVTVLIGLALAAAIGPAYAGEAEGKALFAAKCQSCHGAHGEGKPAIAKMMKVNMPPLGSKELQAKTDAELKAAITKGKGKMKAVSGLSGTNADDLVAFVRTLKQ